MWDRETCSECLAEHVPREGCLGWSSGLMVCGMHKGDPLVFWCKETFATALSGNRLIL